MPDLTAGVVGGVLIRAPAQNALIGTPPRYTFGEPPGSLYASHQMVYAILGTSVDQMGASHQMLYAVIEP